MIVNGILNVVRVRNQWRAMPRDLPPWQTVYCYFRLWCNDGGWEPLHTGLRERLRCRLEREATPRAVTLDSQLVKTTRMGTRAVTMLASK